MTLTYRINSKNKKKSEKWEKIHWRLTKKRMHGQSLPLEFLGIRELLTNVILHLHPELGLLKNTLIMSVREPPELMWQPPLENYTQFKLYQCLHQRHFVSYFIISMTPYLALQNKRASQELTVIISRPLDILFMPFLLSNVYTCRLLFPFLQFFSKVYQVSSGGKKKP